LRRAGPDDAAALADIGRRTFVEAFGHLYPPADLADFLSSAHNLARARADLADPHRAAWLVEAAGEPVGYALAGPCDLPHPQVAPADGELKRLYMLARAQNGGLGGRLFDAVMAWLQEHGPRTVWSANHGAQRFYARRRFARAGEYGFPVGGTMDREFIFRRLAVSFSKDASNRGT
jgi:GNAT superfamily N-acetyltransferase